MYLFRNFAFGIILCLGSIACAQEPSLMQHDAIKSEEILIVYVSRTQNTKVLATLIQQKVGGDLHPVLLEKDYPADYKQTVDQVAQENARGILPALKDKVAKMDKYKIVFVGFPTWGMQLPPPMKSFLAQHQLQGKTLIPFNSNAGYGVGASVQDIRDLCPDAILLEGFSTLGGKERDGRMLVMEGEKRKTEERAISSWLLKLGWKN